jgi:hypothetical protein
MQVLARLSARMRASHCFNSSFGRARAGFDSPVGNTFLLCLQNRFLSREMANPGYLHALPEVVSTPIRSGREERGTLDEFCPVVRFAVRSMGILIIVLQSLVSQHQPQRQDRP